MRKQWIPKLKLIPTGGGGSRVTQSPQASNSGVDTGNTQEKSVGTRLVQHSITYALRIKHAHSITASIDQDLSPPVQQQHYRIANIKFRSLYCSTTDTFKIATTIKCIAPRHCTAPCVHLYDILHHLYISKLDPLSLMWARAKVLRYTPQGQCTGQVKFKHNLVLTNLCPLMVLSNCASKAPQILTVLSAAELASHKPSGLNFTLDTALVWPTSVNLFV